MNTITLVIVAIFIILGVIFSLGKGAFLIAGYNTSSKNEKAKYDEKALCRFMGKSMFALALGIFLWGLSEWLARPFLFTIGLIIFFGTIVFMVVYANTKNRFKK